MARHMVRTQSREKEKGTKVFWLKKKGGGGGWALNHFLEVEC